MDDGALLLEAEGLALGYGRRKILNGVNLCVRRGEFWCLLGPNGEGKTTLLRAILGLLAPLSGRLQLHPELVDRQRIGFVPQRCEFNPSLPTTVREFILLGTVGIPLDRAERMARLDEALSRVGLLGSGSRSYWSLSGGQRQRTHLARALIRRPSLLILDEPTAGLDFTIEEAFLRFLSKMNQEEGQTLLVVTHDLATAREHATHVALIHGGQVRSGPRAGILTEENIRSTYPAGEPDACAAAAGGACA